MSTLQDQLRERVTTRWIHSTGTTPHASGVKPDALCHEAAERLDELEREVEALRVIADAAIVWTYCPSAGGYKDGASVEDTCEDLVAAVETYTGLRSPDDWWTEEEMRAAIDAARSKT